METQTDEPKVRLYKIKGRTIRLITKLAKYHNWTLSAVVDAAIAAYAKKEGVEDK